MEPARRKMTIPEVQAKLHEIAEELPIGYTSGQLHYLADQLARNKPTRKASARSAKMTDVLRHQIVDYWRANPDMTYAEIAHYFNVNPGRVSETIRWWQS